MYVCRQLAPALNALKCFWQCLTSCEKGPNQVENVKSPSDHQTTSEPANSNVYSRQVGQIIRWVTWVWWKTWQGLCTFWIRDWHLGGWEWAGPSIDFFYWNSGIHTVSLHSLKGYCIIWIWTWNLTFLCLTGNIVSHCIFIVLFCYGDIFIWFVGRHFCPYTLEIIVCFFHC